MGSSPSIPKAPPNAPPTPGLTDPDVQAAKAAQRRRLAMMRGAVASRLTGAGGLKAAAPTKTPALTGLGGGGY